MNHQRHIIREALVAALVAANTAAGARVFDHPVDPRTAFPALTVEDMGEAQDTNTLARVGTSPLMRRLRLLVTAEVQQVANYARQRDQLLADVEAACATFTASGVRSVTPVQYSTDVDGLGERPIAIGRQVFEVLYITPLGNPSAAN